MLGIYDHKLTIYAIAAVDSLQEIHQPDMENPVTKEYTRLFHKAIENCLVVGHKFESNSEINSTLLENISVIEDLYIFLSVVKESHYDKYVEWVKNPIWIFGEFQKYRTWSQEVSKVFIYNVESNIGETTGHATFPFHLYYRLTPFDFISLNEHTASKLNRTHKFNVENTK